MPYIDPPRRKLLDLGEEAPQDPGELNYCITHLLNEYVSTCGLSYRTINTILGALEGAKLEFYRRMAAPYENTKIESNGDVYD